MIGFSIFFDEFLHFKKPFPLMLFIKRDRTLKRPVSVIL